MARHRSKVCRALAPAALCGLAVALSRVAGGVAFACGFGSHGLADRAGVRGARTARHSFVEADSVVDVKAKVAAIAHTVDVEEFYKETISGEGGAPLGIERDLICKEFGDGDFKGAGDHATAFSTLKSIMAAGGPAAGEDDGAGWLWLVATMEKDGTLTLALRKHSGELKGKRPLLVAKEGATDEMWEKLNWSVVRRRLNEVVGRPVIRTKKRQEEIQ
eukprot:TRINITY_DN29230_c0_g1_i1.p1 TRINITY_DN29230_c0_g1~~TRINITY_DN29230_c0_g1_i1.p1  ORF type:complete len:240 (+),score=47.32 TRINITY_DN29230_c0_g1_i1:69-722(+)